MCVVKAKFITLSSSRAGRRLAAGEPSRVDDADVEIAGEFGLSEALVQKRDSLHTALGTLAAWTVLLASNKTINLIT